MADFFKEHPLQELILLFVLELVFIGSAFSFFTLFFPKTQIVFDQFLTLGLISFVLLDISILIAALVSHSWKEFALFIAIGLGGFLAFFGRNPVYFSAIAGICAAILFFYWNTRREIDTRTEFQIVGSARKGHSLLLTILSLLVAISYTVSPQFPLKYREINIPSFIFDTALTPFEGQLKNVFPLDLQAPLLQTYPRPVIAELEKTFGLKITVNENFKDVLYRFVHARLNEFLKNLTTLNGNDIFPIAFFAALFFIIRSSVVFAGMLTPFAVYIIIKFLMLARIFHIEEVPAEKQVLKF